MVHYIPVAPHVPSKVCTSSPTIKKVKGDSLPPVLATYSVHSSTKGSYKMCITFC